MSPERLNLPEEALKNPLSRLKKKLADEYEDQPEDEIDQAARDALEELEGARLREFVPIFAWRHAREHLHLRRAS